MNENYFAGMHTGGATDTAQLEALMTQALASGGVDAYAVEMAETGTSTTYTTDDTVRWQVEVVVLDDQWQTLQDYHASSTFTTFLVGGAHALGGTHANSAFEMVGSVYTSASLYAGTAPSPPTL